MTRVNLRSGIPLSSYLSVTVYVTSKLFSLPIAMYSRIALLAKPSG